VTAAAMGGDPIARFAEIAERYCAWAEGPPASAEEESRTALTLLTEIVRSALDLPHTDPEGLDPPRPAHEDWKRMHRRYWAFSFRSHWGEHAVEAIRVLHHWRSEHAR